MKLLTLGKIAELSGYSRVRIHTLASNNRIPFTPVKQPPAGQYRYKDTEELRLWCIDLKKQKPKRSARPRGSNSSIKGMAARRIGALIDLLDKRQASQTDAARALGVLRACHPLILNFGEEDHTCLIGILSTLYVRVCMGSKFNPDRIAQNALLFDQLERELVKAATSAESPTTSQPRRA